jgi:hypothetical protein
MASQCKRDALPAELTARTSEMAAFRPFLKDEIRALAERRGNERHIAAPQVPNYSRSLKLIAAVAWLAWEVGGVARVAVIGPPILISMFHQVAVAWRGPRS